MMKFRGVVTRALFLLGSAAYVSSMNTTSGLTGDTQCAAVSYGVD